MVKGTYKPKMKYIIPLDDMSDSDVLEMFRIKYPKGSRISTLRIKNNDKIMYYQLRKRGLLGSALAGAQRR